MSGLEKTAEEFARACALRYREQLLQLTVTGARQLADSAVERVYEAIANENVTEPSIGPLLDCVFLASVFDTSLFGTNKTHLETKVSYQEKGFWNDDSLFCKSGIVTPEGFLFENAKRSKSKDVLKDSSILSKGWNDAKKFVNTNASQVQHGTLVVKNYHKKVTGAFSKVKSDSMRFLYIHLLKSQ